ncbi:MAG: MBL fold metallo-hydrolase [Clostridia bacterium]|nr:MBL fold metallo-hydrolase [Clostridia bacterium]
MTVKFCSFASGSSGNCYLIKDEETAILIDAGISGKRIFEGLRQTDTPMDMVQAILVTHEHSDHVMSLPILTRKIPGARVYANEATWNSIERPVAEEQQSVFVTGEDFYIGDFIIRPFRISHDAAEPVGFSVFHDEIQISICTDSGYISEEIFEEISRADLLLLEANHEKEMLLYGRYPYPLKQRILGDEGHLSNISCGECLCRMVAEHPKERCVLLGHLSHENNTPDVAMQAIRNTLEEQQIFIGGDLRIEVALRDSMSKIFEIG